VFNGQRGNLLLATIKQKQEHGVFFLEISCRLILTIVAFQSYGCQQFWGPKIERNEKATRQQKKNNKKIDPDRTISI
jgi:hypothetical protein